MFGFIKKLFNKENSDSVNVVDDDGLGFINEYIRTHVRGGYTSREDMIELANDFAEDEGISDYDAAAVIDAEIEQLKIDQQSWPKETDFDRLDATLKQLEENGIVARQNFTCCGTCGAAEIWDEVEEFDKNGKAARGYVFFHEQATEQAVDGYGINFSYGSAKEKATEQDEVAIGQELADALRGAGFKVDWDGTLGMCVMLDLDWKRRWVV